MSSQKKQHNTLPVIHEHMMMLKAMQNKLFEDKAARDGKNRQKTRNSVPRNVPQCSLQKLPTNTVTTNTSTTNAQKNTNTLQEILQEPHIWQGSKIARPGTDTGLSTGYPDLDQALHCGGWPRAGMTEILYPSPGIGEMQLLSPALACLSKQQRWLMLISPPYLPYAPAWLCRQMQLSSIHIVLPKNRQDRLWSIEQALNSKACSVVLAWLDTKVPHPVLRKLQLAAQSNNCWMVVFRPQTASQQHSPAELRMTLRPEQTNNDDATPTSRRQLRLSILKQRGGWSGQELCLDVAPPL